MVCFTCIKRLEGVHRFAMMAYRTQEKLRSLYGNIDNTNPVQDDEMQNIKDMQDTAKKTEDRGLLHSILTKVCIRLFFIYIYHIFICSMYYISLPSSVGCNRNFNRGRATGTIGIKFPRRQTLHSEHGRNGGKSRSNAIFAMWYGTVYIWSFRFLG